MPRNKGKRSRPKVDATRDARRAIIAQLMLRGVTSMGELCKRAKCSRPTLAKDLEAIRAEWRKEMVESFDYAKDQCLKVLEEIEREAWAEWDRSKLGAKKRLSRTTENETGGSTTEEETTERRCGDPRYLEVIIKCEERKTKLLGLDEPERIDLKGQMITIAVELQNVIENNGEFIEYMRHQLLAEYSQKPKETNNE
jgi:hypothetical protein